MKKVLSVILALMTVVGCFAGYTLITDAVSEITITPYGTGMENYLEATQILICPRIAGNWSNEWGNELMKYSWELSLTAEGSTKTVRLKPSSIYPANSWGIIRFTPCLATGENRFVPVKDQAYNLSVKVYNGTSLLYTSDGGTQTWKLTVDPIVPEAEESVTASGDGWSIKEGVLTVTKQSALGSSSSDLADYGWNSYRKNITEVIVSDGITSVGRLAFDSCTILEKVTFAESVDTFYSDCLARNAALKEIIFRGPVKNVGQGIVYLTNNIEKVTINSQTFEEFKAIATKAAYNFESYGGISTGFDKAVFIENIPFTYTVENGVMTISGNGAKVGNDDSAAVDYSFYPSREIVTKIVINDGISAIGAHAFENMPLLTEIRFGKDVKKLGAYALSNCEKLKNVIFEGDIPMIGEGVFKGTKSLAEVALIDHSVAAFKEAAAIEKYNLFVNGGQTTGLDNAKFSVIHVEGVWKEIKDLTSAGVLAKKYDANKDGVTNISDVTTVLNYLSGSLSQWAGNYYNILDHQTNISDVTLLLDALSAKDGVCPHSLSQAEETPATCTSSGSSAHSVCPQCGTALSSVVIYKALGHDMIVSPAVPATCGTDGETEGRSCRRCGEVILTKQTLPATGQHTFIHIDRKEPTCGEDGHSAGTVCSVCSLPGEGYVVLPKTGKHTVVIDQAVVATCCKTGLSEGTHCSVCGQVLTQQKILPALTHQYQNGRCVYCRAADTSILSGKTALFVGDSLCMASTFDKDHQWWGWAGRIASVYGLSSYKNAGIDGASISNCRPTNMIITQINNNKNNKYDFVVLEGSTNDGWDNAPVGTMLPGSASSANPAEFDLSTFAGGLENLFYYAKLYYPNAAIGYLFTHRMNSNIGTLRDMSAYLAVAKQICEKWDIPMLNIDESPDFALKCFGGVSTIVPDGIHPSSIGYDMLYPVIARFMASIALDGSFTIYTAEIEKISEGPEPYAPPFQ